MVRIDTWIAEKSKLWNVSPITITLNMGLDTQGRRSPNFWNIFQAVFWDRALTAQEKLEEFLGSAAAPSM